MASQERKLEMALGAGKSFTEIVHNVRSVLPLATPKTVEQKYCVLCPLPARIMCEHCQVSYYCSVAHLKADSIHPRICEQLTFLGEEQPFCSDADGRERQKERLRWYKLSLSKNLDQLACKLEMENNDKQAKLACKYSANILLNELGQNHTKTFEVLLILALQCIRLREFSEGECYLDKLSLSFSEKSNVSYAIKADLYKTKGLMETAKGHHERALEEFAEEVYYAAHEFGIDHIRAATAYWRLGRSFYYVDKLAEADSLYRQATDVWVAFLGIKMAEVDAAEKQTRLELGPKAENNLEVRVRIDAKDVLSNVYKSRKDATIPTRPRDLMQASYGFAMYLYLQEEYYMAYDIMEDVMPIVYKEEESEHTASMVTCFKMCRRKMPQEYMKFREKYYTHTD